MEPMHHHQTNNLFPFHASHHTHPSTTTIIIIIIISCNPPPQFPLSPKSPPSTVLPSFPSPPLPFLPTASPPLRFRAVKAPCHTCLCTSRTLAPSIHPALHRPASNARASLWCSAEAVAALVANVNERISYHSSIANRIDQTISNINKIFLKKNKVHSPLRNCRLCFSVSAHSPSSFPSSSSTSSSPHALLSSIDLRVRASNAVPRRHQRRVVARPRSSGSFPRRHRRSHAGMYIRSLCTHACVCVCVCLHVFLTCVLCPPHYKTSTLLVLALDDLSCTCVCLSSLLHACVSRAHA